MLLGTRQRASASIPGRIAAATTIARNASAPINLSFQSASATMMSPSSTTPHIAARRAIAPSVSLSGDLGELLTVIVGSPARERRSSGSLTGGRLVFGGHGPAGSSDPSPETS